MLNVIKNTHLFQQFLQRAGLIRIYTGQNPLGVARHFFRDFEQIPIKLLASLFCFGVLDAQHSALGATAVVLKTEPRDSQLPGGDEEPSEDPDNIPQQSRVRRVMDVALHHSTIDPDFSPRLDLVVLGMAYNDPVDLLPGFLQTRT